MPIAPEFSLLPAPSANASSNCSQITMARAFATHCSCPPESCLGNPSRSLEHASTMLRASGLNCQNFDLTEMVAVSVSQHFRTPTVVTHGQRELPGNVSQAFHQFKTPQTLGVPSKMLYFPDDAPCQVKP